jgi:hypothetical protein
MKSNRSVGPVKSPRSIPVSPLTTEHLSALDAFERWQRESPRPGTFNVTADSATAPAQPMKN